MEQPERVVPGPASSWFPRAPIRILNEPYAFTSNERWTLGTLSVVLVLALVAAFVEPVRDALPGCPSKSQLGLDCPGCGLTRACLSMAHLDPVRALAYNPLVLFIGGYAGYLLATALAGLATGRKLVSDWPRWFVRGAEAAFVVVWLGLFVVRLLSWLSPELNPQGYLLPPV